VHGGAGAIADALVKGHLQGCREAAEEGLRLLWEGAPAEEAVERAICLLEDDEVFDAGRGSFLNMDGVVEMDAAFMEGASLLVGAVAGVRKFAHPISLARLVMESEHVLLVGEGATRFALSHGLRQCPAEWLIVPREREAWERQRRAQGVGDTVGAVALDERGHLAVGLSTGGRPFKFPGRVGDVPCVGAGFYVDDGVGGVAASGEGEAILRVTLARRVMEQLEKGVHPQEAASWAIGLLYQRVGGHAGLIVLDRQGRVGCTFNTRRMSRVWNEGKEIIARIERG